MEFTTLKKINLRKRNYKRSLENKTIFQRKYTFNGNNIINLSTAM